MYKYGIYKNYEIYIDNLVLKSDKGRGMLLNKIFGKGLFILIFVVW